MPFFRSLKISRRNLRPNSNDQAFKGGSQEAVATPLCGVFALGVIANRAGALLSVRRWIACSRIVSELRVES
jgi:hypothetical protein